MATSTEINNLISGAKNRADTLQRDASAALGNATKAIADAGKDLPDDLPSYTLPNTPNVPVLPAIPVINLVSLDAMPSQPARPNIQAPDATINQTMPMAPNTSGITVVEPVRPGQTPSFGKSAPTINTNFPAPVRPAAFTGSAPSLTSISMPPAPTRNAPVFSGVRPADVGAAPDVGTAFNSAWSSASTSFRSMATSEVDRFMAEVNPQYRAQLDALEEKLAEFISGDIETGFKPAVEQAIYGRSQARQDAEAKRTADEALTRAARMGFTMPSGALMGAVNKARQAAADNNAQASREIVVMQAEMQQKNLQFALSTSAQLRQSMVQARISYHGNLIQLNGQATQYAAAVADSLVKTYDLAVRAFNARLDAYRADAGVFETLVRASLAEIDVYKAQIEGELAKVKVDEARVQVYRTQVEAHQNAVQAYQTNVQALVALASLEKMKLEGFEAEVRAFSAEVQASKSEWDAYSAAWNGEESKVKALLAQTQVYTAQVEGFRAAVSADATRSEAQARVNTANLNAYEADVRAWGELARANAAKVSATIQAQDSLVKAYQVGSQAVIAQANADAERYRAVAQITMEDAKLHGNHELEAAKLKVSAIKAASDTGVSAAQVYRGLAESAMSGLTTLVTLKQDVT